VGRALLIALLGGLLAVAAAAFGPVLLLLPGCALVLLAVVCAGWALLAGRGRLERRLEATRVLEEEPCAFALEARLILPPPPGSELVEPLSPESRRPVQWRRRHRLEGELRFPRRGLHPLEPARLVVRDPLGIAAREVRSSRGQEVLVLPRIEPVRAARAGARALALTDSSPEMSEEGPRVDFDTLREAPPEAPATRIHWPAVARTGTLIERTLLAPTERRPLVVLDAASTTSLDALDSAVRAAASLCVALARAGGCDLLLPDERRPAHIDSGLAAWPPLHARLALVEEGERVTVPTRLGRVGAIFWVTGGDGDLAGVPGGLLRGAASARFVVAPGPATKGSVFTVAGCHGRRVGRAARRAA
jgi:uncharacterized protein (DUF58 family)